jgi:hypothetical protein
MDLPRYDPSKTYRWNYDHPPEPVDIDVPPVAGEWQLAGLPPPMCGDAILSGPDSDSQQASY